MDMEGHGGHGGHKGKRQERMPDLHQTKIFSEGYSVPMGETYPAPTGEVAVYLVSDGSNRPYRCSIRGRRLRAHQFLADAVVIMDLVFGEVDR
ncbi:hypothetical protein C8R47DRAFT_1224541 [Mycena vitilis]|nr:hypothetical protein C8R47DRAFT_1224541 [Mycena vitilis]